MSIDWLAIVRFHKAIAAREERDFYSLRAKVDDSDRWSSLENFEPVERDGPWRLERRQIRSRSFWLHLRQFDDESLFLGGPGYLGWKKAGRGWSPQWRPLLLREVSLEVDEEGATLAPLPDARWGFSPLFFDVLERVSVSLDEAHAELPDKLFERAARVADPGELHAALLDVLFRIEPAVEGELTKAPRANTFDVAPTPWVLFRSLDRFGPFTRHLMRDYDALEARLERDPTDVGGLALLADSEARAPAAPVEPLPVVPLNDSQRRAVSGILERRPLTVVSGPPGCGKSQVVVSLLLNAWAKGLKVLFASNNNKAVDVVRERLLRFEDTFPVAVRAGSRRHQNIDSLLDTTLSIARNPRTTTGFDMAQVDRVRAGLQQERQKLLDRLDTRLPQRVEEAWRAALRGHGKHQDALRQLAARRKEFERRFSAAGAPARPEAARDAYEATQEWLDALPGYRQALAEDDARRSELEAELTTSRSGRDHAVARIGVEPSAVDNWSWLVSNAAREALENWVARALSWFEGDTEEALAPVSWRSEFDRWTSSEAARTWLQDATSLVGTIREASSEHAQDLETIEQRWRLAKSRRIALAEAGVQDADRIAEELEVRTLQQWRTAFAEHATTPSGFFDFLPWSAASKRRVMMQAAEGRLTKLLPLEALKPFRPIDDASRERLADLVEDLRRWLAAHRAWKDIEPTARRIKGVFSDLRARASALGAEGVPENTDHVAWFELARRLEQDALLAGRAAVAWKQRVAQEEARRRVREVVSAWSRLPTNPLLTAWYRGAGRLLTVTVKRLSSEPSPASLVEARSQLQGEALGALLTTWTAAREAQEAAIAARQALDAVPTPEERGRAWWADRPEGALVFSNPPRSWPDIPPVSEALEPVEAALAAWERYRKEELPVAEAEAGEARDWALEQLGSVLNLLPDAELAGRAQRLVDDLPPQGAWPVDNLESVLGQFSAAQIRRQVQVCDEHLERLSFESAKAEWLRRLEEDEEALRAVGQVKRALKQKRGRIPDSMHEQFEAALRLVPIWITTAQAPQAIPLLPRLFDIVVIDEASQCTVTKLLPLVYRGASLAVIGDEKQLPAIPAVSSFEQTALAKKFGIPPEQLLTLGHADNDVFKAAAGALPGAGSDVLVLDEHYRSHPAIIGFSNRHVYLHQLVLRRDPRALSTDAIHPGVHMRDVHGRAERGSRGRSWRNPAEAEAVLDVVSEVWDRCEGDSTIGVVTPFRAQKKLIQDGLVDRGLTEVFVDTAYGFQGDERDVMVFSPVVAPGMPESSARWVAVPPNQVNVALTRARDALHVVAHFAHCRANAPGILKDLVRYCESVRDLRLESGAELELFHWMMIEGWQPLVHPKVDGVSVSFTLEGVGPKRAVAVFETLEQARVKSLRSKLLGHGYRLVAVSEQQIIETPYEIIARIREAGATTKLG